MGPEELEFSVEALDRGGHWQVEREQRLSCKGHEPGVHDGEGMLVFVAEVETAVECSSPLFLCGVSVEGEVPGPSARGWNAVL